MQFSSCAPVLVSLIRFTLWSCQVLEDRCSPVDWRSPWPPSPLAPRPAALTGRAQTTRQDGRTSPRRITHRCHLRVAWRRQAASRRRIRAQLGTPSKRTAAAWKVGRHYTFSTPRRFQSVTFLLLIFFSFFVDVPAWLKSLRLHKYASLFSQMTYEEMMILTEQHLESQVDQAALDYPTVAIYSPLHH